MDVSIYFTETNVSGVPLWIGHATLYMEGHLKLRLQSLLRTKTLKIEQIISIY